MTKKTSRPTERQPLPSLTEPRASARQKIQKQIEKGQQLLEMQIPSEEELKEARAEYRSWSAYNIELLQRLFDNSSIAEEYRGSFAGVMVGGFPTLLEMKRDFREDVQYKIEKLRSINGRLDLIPEPSTIPSPDIPAAEVAHVGSDVFIVHGHDNEAKETVARFVEKLELNAIILHEKANAGRTIIEKFEDHAGVGFAIVLLTPDDVGASRDKPTDSKSRARQNVIFELGYFMGRLGRERVCAIYKEEVELPSDFSGVVYIPLDISGAWRLSLAREMKHAGLPVDMNNAV